MPFMRLLRKPGSNVENKLAAMRKINWQHGKTLRTGVMQEGNGKHGEENYFRNRKCR